jgi:hypothetical protein
MIKPAQFGTLRLTRTTGPDPAILILDEAADYPRTIELMVSAKLAIGLAFR